MSIKHFLTILIVFFSFLFYQNKILSALEENDNKFLLGNESLLSKNSNLIKGKRIGLITNTSGVLSNGTLFLDALNKDFNVMKIFSPEHGLRADDKNEDYRDEPTQLPIVSLYGSKTKPDIADLEDIDVFVYDIQDVGARFYTFINTMYYCMESAAENGKEMIICDRPMIPYANYVDGFMLDESVKSFVGLINVPIAYGMTCGELANYINAEYFNGKCKLTVVTMENYSRDTEYESLNLPWIKPSPNMYYPSSAVCYLGTCLFEGTNFAEGRGTGRPFEYVGAPYCNGKELAAELNSFDLMGALFKSTSFTPQTVSSASNPPKFIGENCQGIFIDVVDNKTFQPVKAVIAILVTLKKFYPEFQINENYSLDRLAGTPELRIMLNNGSSYDEIIDYYSYPLSKFKAKRDKYLLYK